MAERIQVYILSRNRPVHLLQTIESALNLDYENYEIIVSDNSTNDDVFNALEVNPNRNRFQLIRRKPMRFFNEHVNLILSEVSASYFMIFHDDDLLSPNCLKIYSNLMRKHPELAACAGNAKLIYQDEKSENLFSNVFEDFILNDSEKFLKYYFDLSHGHQPFPFYFYRTEKIRGLEVIYNEGRIHSDTAFIYKVMQRGGLYWSKEIIGFYRLHAHNTSRFINMRAVSCLCRFFKKNLAQEKLAIVNRYHQRSRLQYYIQNRNKIFYFIGFERHRKLMLKTMVFMVFNLGFYLKKVLCFFCRTFKIYFAAQRKP